jgi:type IV secretion system protein VirD4
MIQSLKENTSLRVALGFVLLALVIGVWAYLAGGIFLVAYNKKFDDATPITLWQYWHYYGSDAAVMRWIYIASGIAAALTLSPGLLFIGSNKRSLFGDARFAKTSEIRRAGLLGEKGIIVGRYGKNFLMFAGQQHAIISAPTRSGKGVGIVIPNLLNWPDSVVVLDIKQENWDITSAYRKKFGQECYLFNPAPADYRTHRYNPLFYISDDPNFRIDDVQKIANMLFPDQAGTDPIWTATPRSLFLGIVLSLAETPDKLVTLGQVLRETLTDGDGSSYFTKLINTRAADGKPFSGPCVRALNSYISISSENTRAGVITSFRSRLELWMNPLVDAATSANDFDLRDIRKRRMSIYIGVTPDNLERMAPLINLFFQQLIDLNTRELPNQNKTIKYTCLLLMDEFTAIGKIGVISKGIGYLAGYWLRMMPIIQSPAQLVEVYGKEAAQTFTTNHALNIIFPPKASETQTARDISEWLGYQTVKGTSTSKAKSVFAKKPESENISDQRRALLLPQEITALGQDRALIIIENVPAILAKKVVYFQDASFTSRLKDTSKTLRQLGNKTPSRKQLDAAIEAGELSAGTPKLDLTAHAAAVDFEAPQTVKAPASGNSKTIIIERPFVAADIPKLESMTLADFAVDFSSIEKPENPENMDTEALNVYADKLCEQLGIL